MDNMPRFLVSLVIIMIAVLIGVSLVVTNFYIGSVRSYQDQVTKALSGADFTDSQIEQIKADAISKGYLLEVNKTENEHIYKVDLSYKITVPIFGTLDSNKLTSYVLNYAALAQNSVNSPLDAPVISLLDKGIGPKNDGQGMSLLKIEKVDEAERYLVFVDGEARLNITEAELAASADRTIDLSVMLADIMPVGTPMKYVITAKASATRACNDSPFSNSVVFVANCQHNYQVTETVAPTCTEVGYTMYSCWICEDVCRDDEVPALGHSFGDWYSANDAQHRRDCKRDGCDHFETADHTWNAGVVTTQPTCTETG